MLFLKKYILFSFYMLYCVKKGDKNGNLYWIFFEKKYIFSNYWDKYGTTFTKLKFCNYKQNAENKIR